MLNRFPIRLRLAAAFALAMALVLAAMGAFLYLRLGSSLDESIDQGLQTRAAELSALAARGDTSLDQGPGDDETFAQVLDSTGQVIDATPQLGDRPLLDPAEHGPAAQGGVRLERNGTRLLATPVDAEGETLVVVAGASLEERDEALNGFLGELLIGGPVALFLASLLGYGVATAALRPVEAMRAEAAEVSAVEPGRRLPLSRARDEISRLGTTLNDMLGRLERALERERNFVADASHELRTPLALLKTELELALRNPRSQEELKQALRSAAAETDRLAQLAEDLLVLARSDQGRLPLRRDPVSVHDVLSGVAARFGRRAEEAGRAIEIDAVDGLFVPADSVRLEQALGNLVENALRHGEGSIRLRAVEANGRVELHVQDEGKGMPAEFVPRAFERFTRADHSRAGAGAGLGLAIAQVIATAHGGSAHVSGADVWLSIPKSRVWAR